jgi:hypothetical protein
MTSVGSRRFVVQSGARAVCDRYARSVPPTPFPSHRPPPPFPPSLTLFHCPPLLQVDEYYYGNRCAASFWHMQRCEALPPSNSLPPSPSTLCSNDIQRAQVQNVIGSVLKELEWNPDRKFICKKSGHTRHLPPRPLAP